mmetsp:Transcript_14834/g.32278  ORF Transcript_14834/g.32278 Transcript_14834/m.32278 type:complete len:95 (-) Transcript_14834:152-436(-)
MLSMTVVSARSRRTLLCTTCPSTTSSDGTADPAGRSSLLQLLLTIAIALHGGRARWPLAAAATLLSPPPAPLLPLLPVLVTSVHGTLKYLYYCI